VQGTRRELLGGGGRAAVAAVGGMLLAPAGALAASALTEAPPPRELLSHALDAEGLAAFALDHVERHFRLPRHGRMVLRALRAHERAHARALEQALAPLGGPLPEPSSGAPRNVAEADRAIDALDLDGSIAGLRDTKHALELLLRIEYAQEGAYYRMVEYLSDPLMALMAAQALAVEAQHVVLLRELHQPGYLEGAAPDSFVVGPR
jgi:hypothetical protein